MYGPSGGDQSKWAGNRASLSQQGAGMAFSKATLAQGSMNRVNQHKFQQIARPYIMSSSGSALQKNLKSQLGTASIAYASKNFGSNGPMKYSVHASFAAGSTDKELQLLRMRAGLPDSGVVQSQTLAEARHSRHPGSFSPKTTAAALQASEPGHRSQAAFDNTHKFSPGRPVGPLYGLGSSEGSAAE